MQAIILAAGMGKRLGSLTQNNTKCMVEINGVKLIERVLRQLDALHLSRVIIVSGYQADNMMQFIRTLPINTPIVEVQNPIYDTTNNIYSLYLARVYLKCEDTLLLESDLIFEDAVLERLVSDPRKDLALVAKYESWMDGTVTVLDDVDNIVRFIDKHAFSFEDISIYFKTVNIYKFSQSFSRTCYVPFLEAYVSVLGKNEYYEQVLRVIANLDRPGMQACRLQNEKWYEIDDIQDLDIAESVFVTNKKDKWEKINKRYGGFWRYPGLLDYCYLVNPYYPPQHLIDEMKASFETVLHEYPSGLKVNNLLAAKQFNVKQPYICVGNGAAELINVLMRLMPGKVGIIRPTFEEYANRHLTSIEAFQAPAPDFRYNESDLIAHFSQKRLTALVLINPDNPSGNYIGRKGLIKLVEWARSEQIRLIVDESFAGFAEPDDISGMLTNKMLEDNRHLVVVRSISKTYGVPGLRLGIMASADTEFMDAVREEVSIWNINSIAEFYMQICEKYAEEYKASLYKLCASREALAKDLQEIGFLRVLPSDANYIMCEVIGGMTASETAISLLDRYNILIKDLSRKTGISGEYVRLSIRADEENAKLVEALKELQSTQIQ